MLLGNHYLSSRIILNVIIIALFCVFCLQRQRHTDKDRFLHQCAPPTGIPGWAEGRRNDNRDTDGEGRSDHRCRSDVMSWILLVVWTYRLNLKYCAMLCEQGLENVICNYRKKLSIY